MNNTELPFGIITLLKAIPDEVKNDDNADWPIDGAATVDLLDYENMEIDPKGGDESIAQYMGKGAPITWDHNREIIIGKATKLWHGKENGRDALLIKGIQYAPNKLEGVAREKAKLFRSYHKLGQCKGLSIDATTRPSFVKRVQRIVKGAGQTIPRVVKWWLYDITITPLQVNQAAQFTVPGLALSKALKTEAFKELYEPERHESAKGKPYMIHNPYNWF